jgi:diguanylate cyclase (GGDEF)-like protein
MIKLAQRFLGNRAAVIANIPRHNGYLILRHRLFLKLLDFCTVAMCLVSFVYIFTNIGSILGYAKLVPLLLLALFIANSVVYAKTSSLKIAGTMLLVILYITMAIPSLVHVVASNYVSYFLLLLPMLALLTLGRPAFIISGLVSIAAIASMFYLHDASGYSIARTAANERAGIVTGLVYIVSYLLVVYGCSAYERIIHHEKLEILATKKALVAESKLDPLLHIYSRKALIEKVNQLKLNPNPLAQKVSVIAVTLKGLRDLNQHYGQNFANDVMLILTARLNSELAKTDILGRVADHEFVIIKMTNSSKAVKLFFNKLITEVCEPISFDGHTTEIVVNAGRIVYDKNAVDLASLLGTIEMKTYDKNITSAGL